MYTSKVLGKLVIPAAVVVSAASKQTDQSEGNVCRPSELPIYTKDPTAPAKVEETGTPSQLENACREVRQTYTKYSSEIKAYQRVGIEHLKESKDNAQWLIAYLQEENNTTPKAGAIGIGALTGLIFGLRGGLIKKTLYATVGALGMASICYPKEAAEYSEVALVESKRYATIAYNFAYGVKKDDPPIELPSLPKLPVSFPDAWENVKQTAMGLISGDSVKKVENVPPNAEKTEKTDKPSK